MFNQAWIQSDFKKIMQYGGNLHNKEMENISSELRYSKALIEKFESKYYSSKDKFKKYSKLYRDFKDLCDHTHNNFNILDCRHSRIENGSVKKVKRIYSLDKIFIYFSLNLMIEYIFISTIFVQKYLKTIPDSNLHNIKKYFEMCKKIIDPKITKAS